MARKRSRLLRNARLELARALDAHAEALHDREVAGAAHLDAAIDRLRIRRVRVVRVAGELVDLVLTEADRRDLGGHWAQAELFDDDADLGELPPEPGAGEESDMRLLGGRPIAFFEGRNARVEGLELDVDAGDDWREGWEDADEMIRTGVVKPGPVPGSGTDVPGEVLGASAGDQVDDVDGSRGDGMPHDEETYGAFRVGGRARANGKATTVERLEITRYAESNKIHRARAHVRDDDNKTRTIPAAWLEELEERSGTLDEAPSAAPLRARRRAELENLKPKALDKVAAELEFRDVHGYLVGTGLAGADELALNDLLDAIVDVERGAWAPLPAWASTAGPGERRIAIPVVRGHEGLPSTMDMIMCGGCSHGVLLAVVNLDLSPTCPVCGAGEGTPGLEAHRCGTDYRGLDVVLVVDETRDGEELGRWHAIVTDTSDQQVRVRREREDGAIWRASYSRRTGIAIGDGGKHSPNWRKLRGRVIEAPEGPADPFVVPVRLETHTEVLDYYEGDVAEVVQEDAEGVEIERWRVDVGDVNGRWIYASWRRDGEPLSVAKFHRYSGVMNNDEITSETGRRRIVARVTS